MLVRYQLGPVQYRVRGSPFSHALIRGDPNPIGSGPPPPYAYKRHASQGLPPTDRKPKMGPIS
jgi:hypothetical protein